MCSFTFLKAELGLSEYSKLYVIWPTLIRIFGTSLVFTLTGCVFSLAIDNTEHCCIRYVMFIYHTSRSVLSPYIVLFADRLLNIIRKPSCLSLLINEELVLSA